MLKEWDHAVEQWILRLNLLSQWCPELRPAAHRRRRPPPPGRATLPRRLRLQGHQGQARQAGREEPGSARPSRSCWTSTPRNGSPAQRPHPESHLRAGQPAAYRAADPGALRRERHAPHRHGPRAGRSSTSLPPTCARCRSPRTWPVSGASITRASSRSSSANTPNTSGAEVRPQRCDCS